MIDQNFHSILLSCGQVVMANSSSQVHTEHNVSSIDLLYDAIVKLGRYCQLPEGHALFWLLRKQDDKWKNSRMLDMVSTEHSQTFWKATWSCSKTFYLRKKKYSHGILFIGKHTSWQNVEKLTAGSLLLNIFISKQISLQNALLHFPITLIVLNGYQA